MDRVIDRDEFHSIGAIADRVIANARQKYEARFTNWLIHAQGCRRRAHEYRRWADEYPAGHVRGESYRRKAADQWTKAKDALRCARQALDAIQQEEDRNAA